MNIIGPDLLIFGVDNVEDCQAFAKDYGLNQVSESRFIALDGTGIEIYPRDHTGLPKAMETGTTIRKTVYGVADQATLDSIQNELSKDRDVKVLEDGSLESVDDMGFVLGFQITIRQALDLPAETVNAPGASPQRKPNEIALDPNFSAQPRTLSHVVYFVPDANAAEAFFRDRLGFVTTDRFTHVGPFMRPAGTQDHHTLFFINTPPHIKGIEHFTFHMSGPTEVMQAGTTMVNKGYESFWGPGRHIFGSNWFWYFKSPFGCNMEYDADMDLHDLEWTYREALPGADTSQAFLLQYREKWAPMGPPPTAK